MVTKPRYFSVNLPYHLYNCGVEKRKTFEDSYDYNRFLNVIDFYCYDQTIAYSEYKKLGKQAKKTNQILNPRTPERKRVDIISYCIMPNHFHFVIKPAKQNGITKFMSDISNSYTKYFNNKYDRVGILFQGPFKSKEITTEESLLNLTRYIHLNPPQSKTLNKTGTLEPEDYPYSSYPFWLQQDFSNPKGLELDKASIMNCINLAGGIEKYKKFVKAGMKEHPTLKLGSLTIDG